jgi:glycosyltransferase involved in cell wall biosynthesis
MAQFWLWKNLLPTSTLLCFGNLPPLFNVKGTVIVFIQNRYIIDDIKLKKLSFKIRLRLFFERIWFNGRCHKVNEFIVQTSSMKILLKKRLLELRPELANMVPIKVSPFIENISINGYTYTSSSNDHSKRFDYIYPASGEAHKNHKKLIDAFIILAEQGHFPSLVLTLDEKKFPEILQEVILEKEKFNLNIVNMGFLPHSELLRLYSSIRYLIYPSFFESFGIPLVEAQQAGLPIIAAELDYVRDSVNPDQSFDPNSSVSIARAIKRSLGLSDELATVLDADKFLLKISPPL